MKDYRTPPKQGGFRKTGSTARVMAPVLRDKDDGYQDIQTGNADTAVSDIAGERRPDDG
jgi:hypothetical protein